MLSVKIVIYCFDQDYNRLVFLQYISFTKIILSTGTILNSYFGAGIAANNTI